MPTQSLSRETSAPPNGRWPGFNLAPPLALLTDFIDDGVKFDAGENDGDRWPQHVEDLLKSTEWAAD